MASFESLKIQKSLLNILKSQNCVNPYPIQEKVIPAVLKGSDVLGIAKTGSGKTLSYVLPILEGHFHVGEALMPPLMIEETLWCLFWCQLESLQFR